MLLGSGGNIGVLAGDDGVFLVDDQFAPLTKKIKGAIGKISDQEIRFVINTHWHFDHVGGNENLGETGSVIIAHENVRKRMSTDQFIEFFQKKVPAWPKVALPIITFTQDLTFHLNGEDIHVFHVNNAHTDGDAIVYFRNSNVIHTGDIYFAGIYPFIDTSTHGSVNGVIDAAQHILAIIDDDTKVIPGHGPLSNKAELSAYVDMLISLRAKITKQISDGKTLEDIQNTKPAQEFDEKWGHGMLTSDKFVQILYTDLSVNRK
jgi:glyoxylase-like metal-dependent hydrolase (beta-lactamase superfamily II)